LYSRSSQASGGPRRTGADRSTLWAIEGVASYGAGLAAACQQAGYGVVEAARMNTRAHRGVGKSDPLDAQRIAAAVLAVERDELRRPRMADVCGLRCGFW